MNRSELAALISSTITPPTPHSSAAIRAPHYSPGSQSHHILHNSTWQHAHPPRRQNVQASDTRSKVDTGPERQPTLPALKPDHPPLSRPKHAHSYSSLPQVKTPHIVTSVARNGREAIKPMVAEIEEPDFVIEEREAWGRKSPNAEKDCQHHPVQPSCGRTTRGSYPNPGIVLQPPRQSSEPPPQPRKQTKQTLPLREFGPVSEETSFDARPKTSRGPSSYVEVEANLGFPEDATDYATTNQATRRSKFLEGSLNERSAAVASSWYDHDSVSEDSDDSDSTPRASRGTREDVSFEGINSKAVPVTPATAQKKGLFKLKNSAKSGENGGAAENQAVPKKRGLRKSLSTWNFHNLGDKMRIFGGSATDLMPKAVKPETLPPSKAGARNDLEERKRKAEEAYTQQFGLKKQKSNSGIANPMLSSQTAVSSKPSSLKYRTPSSSSKTPPLSYRNLVQPSTMIPSIVVDRSSTDLDNSKRPSRKELEKENRHLRRMLRESSSVHFDPRRSSAHLPLDDDGNITRLSQESFAQGHEMRISPGKMTGRRCEDVPPVPKLPREVLGSLENGRSTRESIDRKGMLPRPVSMILEEEENKEVHSTANSAKGVTLSMAPDKEPWEWPDDVF